MTNAMVAAGISLLVTIAIVVELRKDTHGSLRR
jgi:hypothetical protein